MKNLSFLFFSLLLGLQTYAQQQTFDIVTFAPPKNWTKSEKPGTITFTKETTKGEFCVLTIYKSADATTNAQQNFDLAWQSLVQKNLGVTTNATMQPGSTDNGWETKMGSAPFEKDGIKGAVILVSSSQSGKMVNLLALTNSNTFETELETFLASVSLKKPTATSVTQNVAQKIVSKNSNYKFTTSNFDDGWVSNEREDWVEVTKGDIKVLIHYPKEGTLFPADPEVITNAAWNILVAPRYSNLKNYKTSYINEYERPYLAMGDAVDKATGKAVFILLFNRANSGWLEVITKDLNSFIQQFKVNPYDMQHNSNGDLVKPIAKMATYNRFAIAASDFSGKWTTTFANNTHYVNTYTGYSAGMSTYTSSEEFNFFSGQKYNWHLVAANTFAGSTKAVEAKGDGNFKILNNWQIQFTNMSGKTKTFDAYFGCTKGGRIFWMNDANSPGSGIFTGFAKAK